MEPQNTSTFTVADENPPMELEAERKITPMSFRAKMIGTALPAIILAGVVILGVVLYYCLT